MRYKIDQPPDPEYPYSAGMHHMLTFTVGLSLLIGLFLVILSRRGGPLWLKVWSVALVVISAGYLGADLAGIL